MLNKLRYIKLIKIFLLCLFVCDFRVYAEVSQPCKGKFINPLNICWSCFFPITLGNASISKGSFDASGVNKKDVKFICHCKDKMFPGVTLGFWEPANIVEVVRTNLCFPSLNGMKIGGIGVCGTHQYKKHKRDTALYHVHLFKYPLLNQLGLPLAAACAQPDEVIGEITGNFFTELFPFWDNDDWNFVISPEAFIFSHEVMQLACSADSIKANIDKNSFGSDALFWCSGSAGSVYPLTGNQPNHIGGVNTSLLLTHKAVFMGHRIGLLKDTSTRASIKACSSCYQPFLRKNQYKLHMLQPVLQNKKAYGFGETSLHWEANKEFPYEGEDFVYLLWRRRQCCAFTIL